MATLKKFNLAGELQNEEVEVSNHFEETVVHGQMIKDYIVALRANIRQWSACTKTRSQVNHTTHKPYAQKGTGRARHGSFVAPQYRGGGRAFGPKPKFDQHVKINRKERRAAIRSLIGEKITEGQVFLIDSVEMEAPKTRIVGALLATLGLDGRVLFLGESGIAEIDVGNDVRTINVRTDRHDNFVKSARNMQGVKFQSASSISGYDVLLAEHLIMTEEALRELESWLCTASAYAEQEEERS